MTRWNDTALGVALGLGQLAPYMRAGVINGNNPAVSTTYEDVNDVGGTYPLLAAPAACHVASSSAADTAAGTGARTVRIEGLDAAGAELTVDVALNGTTPVALGTFSHVWRVTCATFGSGALNAGDVTVSITAGAVALVRAVAGQGMSQNTVYRVPAGFAFSISSFFLNADNGTNTVHWRFCFMAPGSGGWLTVAIFYHGDNAQPIELRPAPIGVNAAFPSGSVIRWQARCPGGGTAAVSTGMAFVLTPNEMQINNCPLTQ